MKKLFFTGRGQPSGHHQKNSLPHPSGNAPAAWSGAVLHQLQRQRPAGKLGVKLPQGHVKIVFRKGMAQGGCLAVPPQRAAVIARYAESRPVAPAKVALGVGKAPLRRPRVQADAAARASRATRRRAAASFVMVPLPLSPPQATPR